MLLNNLTMQGRIVDVEPLVLVFRRGRQVWGVGEGREEKSGNPSFHIVTFQGKRARRCGKSKLIDWV